MLNVHSSDGIAEDLIRAFIQFGSAEIHLKTLVEKTLAKIENPAEGDDQDQLLSDLTNYEEQMEAVAMIRRKVMLHLYEMYNGNKDAWCLVKHLGVGAMEIFEAYQASDNDPELFALWEDSNKALTKALCVFLGVEITDCAACFADMLREK